MSLKAIWGLGHGQSGCCSCMRGSLPHTSLRSLQLKQSCTAERQRCACQPKQCSGLVCP